MKTSQWGGASPIGAQLGEKETPQGGIETARQRLADSFFTMTHGMRLRQWLTLLQKQRSEITAARLPRALFITAMCLLNSFAARIEARCFDKCVAATPLEPPLFIIGHWRSGTTLLHNLLARDPQFSAPTLLQTLYPHTFLLLERPVQLFAGFLPRTRLVDHMQFGFDEPQEDEFALCNATLLSPYLGWMLPRHQVYYDRYLTLDHIPDEELRLWQRSFVHFLRKVQWRTGGRLLLKSPTHTARIRCLLQLFPNARFVHIIRNPYRVFQSTKHLHQVMFRTTSLQGVAGLDLDELVLHRYELLYQRFWDEKQLIPAGHYCEVRYEELEAAPLDTVEALYSALGLSGFQRLYPQLVNYVTTLKGYRKNHFAPLSPELRDRINQRWRFSFQAWKYSMDTGEAVTGEAI